MISLLLVAALACPHPRGESCRVLCLREGYTGGFAKGRSCECRVLIDETYDDFAKGRRTLGEVQHPDEPTPTFKSPKTWYSSPENREE